MDKLFPHLEIVKKARACKKHLCWKSIHSTLKAIVAMPPQEKTQSLEISQCENTMILDNKAWFNRISQYVTLKKISKNDATISYIEEIVEYENDTLLGYLHDEFKGEDLPEVIEPEIPKEITPPIEQNADGTSKKQEKAKEEAGAENSFSRLFDEGNTTPVTTPPNITPTNTSTNTAPVPDAKKDERKTIPPKKTVSNKEQIIDVSISAVTTKIPVHILIYINEELEEVSIVIDCNQVINEIVEYFKKEFKFLALSLYCESKLIDSSVKVCATNIKPDSVLFAYPVGSYKIFKRLGNGDSSWSTGVNKWDAVGFEATRNLMVCGFSTYTPTTTGGSHTISYKYKLNNIVVCEGTDPISYDGNNRIAKYELSPDKYINMRKMDKLVVMQYVNGTTTYRGSKYNGKQEEIFKIKSASESVNGTGTTDGQIAELFYIII